METRAPSSEASSESVGHRSCRDTALFAMRNSWRACIAVMVATSERLSCQTIVNRKQRSKGYTTQNVRSASGIIQI